MIKIDNREYILKYTVRALFAYERMTGVTFTPEKLLNEYTLMYAILIANNFDFRLTFEEFIDKCDEDQSIFIEFRKWFLAILKQKAILQAESEESASDNKKKD